MQINHADTQANRASLGHTEGGRACEESLCRLAKEGGALEGGGVGCDGRVDGRRYVSQQPRRSARQGEVT